MTIYFCIKSTKLFRFLEMENMYYAHRVVDGLNYMLAVTEFETAEDIMNSPEADGGFYDKWFTHNVEVYPQVFKWCFVLPNRALVCNAGKTLK